MADNSTLPATGDVIASDDVGGVKYQRVKITTGADGVAGGDVTPANPFAVVDATVAAKIAAPVSTVPDNLAPANPVRLVGQDIWNCSFSDVGASVLSSDFITPIVGTGVGYSQAAGALLITTGTTANAEFLTRSTVSWRASMRAKLSVVTSQRIANQNLIFMMGDLVGEGLSCTINSATSITVTKVAHGFTAANIGQFIFVGGIVGAAGVPGRYAIASVPTADTINFTVAGWPASGSCTLTLFGWSHVKTLITGTTATNAAFTSQRRGWGEADTTAVINTTASPGTILQLDLDGRSSILSDTVRASSPAPNVQSRASRLENIPDDNLNLYMWIFSYNGSTAPASTTTWTLSFATVEKFANIPVYIQGQKPVGLANPTPVQVGNTITVTGTITASNVQPTTPTMSLVSSAATTNGTVVKATAGTIYSLVASNTGAAVAFLKLHNSATVTAGTTAVALVVPIPAGGVVSLECGFTGIRFGTGICFSITNLAADNDTTAIAAAQVKVAISYV